VGNNKQATTFPTIKLLNINKRQIPRGSGCSAQTPSKHIHFKSRIRENR